MGFIVSVPDHCLSFYLVNFFNFSISRASGNFTHLITD